ncbi:MAG: TdeIII family type II restriction endonuclease [Nanoarchaeota archaeon]|nr:TdeIII family type II restriction endonuclease [Nanoarchaeota archaeon]
MALKEETKKKVKQLVKEVILSKIENYNAETEYKPFFQAIFTKEQILTHTIVHSFYTTFGISIYERLVKILAEGAGYEAYTQYDLLGEIDAKTEAVISKLDMELRAGKRKPDMISEFDEIKNSIQKGKSLQDPDKRVDVYIKKKEGTEVYFDITSPKPNIKEFVALKKKLLRWIGLRLSTNKNAKVITALGLPYNPYYPQPYNRWTKGNMYDSNQLMVGEDFWNFVAGGNIYNDFIEIFKEVGEELREKIKEIAKK